MTALYLYVFFFSPASCSNVQKKIDETVQQNTVVQARSARDIPGESVTPGKASLHLQVPAELTGETQEDLLLRDTLSARTISGRVQRREKFTQSLVRNGVDAAEARRLVGAFESRNLFNFARAQPGQLFTAQINEDGTRIFTFEYIYSSRMKLQAARTPKGFTVQKITTPELTTVTAIGARIASDLKTALESVGENAQLVPLIAALFRDELSMSELERGDSVRILVERKTINKKFSRYGPLLAIQLVSRKKGSYFAFRGPNGGYYTAEGLSFFRFFLPRPLPGNAPEEPDPRTGGVLFPAHRNPPVWTLAPGQVVEAGWAGPLGRRVIIEHEKQIRSSYYQLGSIPNDLKVGDTVTRRQVIGTAGYSGTTPDKNGVGVLVTQAGKPVSIYALSTSRQDQLPPDLLPAFLASVEQNMTTLSELQIEGMGVSRAVTRPVEKKDPPQTNRPAETKRKNIKSRKK